MSRKVRSDKGKKRGPYKKGKRGWSFKQEIRKKITNLKKTVEQITKKYQQREVKRLMQAYPDMKKRDINKLAKQHAEGYKTQMTLRYAEQRDFLLELKDKELDKANQRYVAQFVNTDLGIGGEALGREGNFNMRVLEYGLQRTNDVQSLFNGLTPDQISDFVYFLKDEGKISDTEKFFYEYLDQDSSPYTNEEIMADIMEFIQQENIENEFVNKMKGMGI